MAIATPTSVFTNNVSTDGANGTSSASLTTVAGRLYCCVVNVTSGSAAVPDGTLTQAGETWTKVTNANVVMRGAGIANAQRLTLWWCVAVGVTAALVWTGGGGTMNGFAWLVSEIASGFNPTTPIAQGANTASQADTDGDFDVTLGAFVDANSITMSAAMHLGSATVFTVPTGWTSTQVITTASPTSRVQVAHILSNDTVADWTSVIASGEDIGGIAWEIAAASVAAALAGGTTLGFTTGGALSTGIPLGGGTTFSFVDTGALTTGIPLGGSALGPTFSASAAMITAIKLAGASTGPTFASAAGLSTGIVLLGAATGPLFVTAGTLSLAAQIALAGNATLLFVTAADLGPFVRIVILATDVSLPTFLLTDASRDLFALSDASHDRWGFTDASQDPFALSDASHERWTLTDASRP